MTLLGGRDSNPDSRHQKPLSCQLNDPRKVVSAYAAVGVADFEDLLQRSLTR
jgi:hypothetical protein